MKVIGFVIHFKFFFILKHTKHGNNIKMFSGHSPDADDVFFCMYVWTIDRECNVKKNVEIYLKIMK